VGGPLTTSPLLSPVVVRPEPVSDGAAAAQREHQRGYLRWLVVLDATVLTIAVLCGYVTRFGDDHPRGSDIPYALVGPGLVLAWLLSLKVLRCYDDRVLGYGADEYRRVVSVSLRLAGAIAITGYIADVGVSRGFLGISVAVGTTGLVIARFGARKVLHRARARGVGWSRRVLVVGDAAHVLELVGTLRREPYAGYQVVGACIPDALLAPTTW
jgi:FlaA1/EpsC-like NDP-sugar epimerase